MQRIDHYFLAKILDFGSLVEKFTDIVMLFKDKMNIFWKKNFFSG